MIIVISIDTTENSILLAQRKCEYKEMTYDAVNPGKKLRQVQDILPPDIRGCQDQCDGDPACYSIRWCPNTGGCILFDKVFSGMEEMVDKSVCRTSYQTTCDGVGMDNAVLNKPYKLF